jgi:hypothetical protein
MTKLSQGVVLPFRKRAASRRLDGQLDLFDGPFRTEASLRASGEWGREAMRLGAAMVHAEARRMLALKTVQALASAPPGWIMKRGRRGPA